MSPRQRIAGAAVSGVVWMAFWGAMGAAVSVLAGAIDPAVVGAGEGPVDLAKLLAPIGLLCGAVFGAIVGPAPAPILRTVLWGVAAAVAVRYLTPVTQGHISNIVVLGALSGLLSAGVARWTRGVEGRPGVAFPPAGT